MPKEDIRENEIEFIAYGQDEKTIGTVWWNGKKINSDSKMLLARLKDLTIKGLTMEDGVEFLDELPARFNSYLNARKI